MRKLTKIEDGLCSAADMKRGEATGSFVIQTQEPSINTRCKLGKMKGNPMGVFQNLKLSSRG